MVDATEALEDLLNMLRFVSFTIDYARAQRGLKHLQNIQRVSSVEILDELIRDLEHQFSLTPGCDLDPPQFRVLDRRQANISLDIIFSFLIINIIFLININIIFGLIFLEDDIIFEA